MLVFILTLLSTVVSAQTAPPLEQADPALTLATNLIGKALFLRDFYAADDLIYEASGYIVGSPRVTDWTLAAINVQKTARHGRAEIELTGVRVAIRYNAQSHQFERHPLASEPIRMLIGTLPLGASTGDVTNRDAEQFSRALAAIFAIGIDPAFQRSTPAFWRHYFDPALAWDSDTLTGTHIFNPGSASPNSAEADQLKRLISPIADHRETPRYTDLALHDKVDGQVELRMVVDAEGTPRRLVITRPIGYGLDARAIEAIQKWRFRPGSLDGKPVAVTILLRENFEVQPHP